MPKKKTARQSAARRGAGRVKLAHTSTDLERHVTPAGAPRW